ncbi:hypothetical protein BD310DRAFT_213597 [Dichomitus squalens]|uniref:Uncharacterized protein n=1 Tax=Dichomitus squalens TaxID=114155 RepID=A0A4V2K8T3_9APHY|nr:hypothetical protein BD310DRAFT_213597 [Dichomitus squalens]
MASETQVRSMAIVRRAPSGQQRPSSLFTLVTHLFTGVWMPIWVERAIAPRRRCSAAATSFLTMRVSRGAPGSSTSPSSRRW